ncbi:MAG: histidine--tRNA ligase [Acidiferrobacteraceae bacterium]
MTTTIRAVRGMNDLAPDTVALWQSVERGTSEILGQYGYREIRFPIVEKTELYARSIGAVTDIVEKEMYSFEDRSGESLTLRPEGTAGCVRAGIENGLFHNQVQRLWYGGPMFRHERPQKGRYRQFHQIGVEAYGIASPDIDAELILLTARLWRVLGLEGARLEINSLGTAESRAGYRSALVSYLTAHQEALDEDSVRRLSVNPLRILDSKNQDMQDLIRNAPALPEYLDQESRQHFDAVQSCLRDAGIEFTVNARLVRGLDYYNRTVFEWTSDRLGAQAAVCAGGRYDGLVQQLGGGDVPAVGFAIGMERLVELLGTDRGTCGSAAPPHAYVVIADPAATQTAMQLAEDLRDHRFAVILHCGGGSIKSQMRRADRSGARCAVLVSGAGPVVVKRLTPGGHDVAHGIQEEVQRPALRAYLTAHCGD